MSIFLANENICGDCPIWGLVDGNFFSIRTDTGEIFFRGHSGDGDEDHTPRPTGARTLTIAFEIDLTDTNHYPCVFGCYKFDYD